jgi:hypothetical protein
MAYVGDICNLTPQITGSKKQSEDERRFLVSE